VAEDLGDVDAVEGENPPRKITGCGEGQAGRHQLGRLEGGGDQPLAEVMVDRGVAGQRGEDVEGKVV
jgi:hypothetical protein